MVWYGICMYVCMYVLYGREVSVCLSVCSSNEMGRFYFYLFSNEDVHALPVCLIVLLRGASASGVGGETPMTNGQL